MENSLKSRLMEFIASRKISVRRFEIECGFPNSYVSNLKSNITSKRLDAIVARYPELNVAWLLTGRGDMVRMQPKAGTGQETVVEPMEQRLADMNMKLMQTVADLSEREMEMNRRYQNCIDFMLSHKDKILAAFEAEQSKTAELMSHINRIQEQNQNLIEMINNLICMYHNGAAMAPDTDSERKAPAPDSGIRCGTKS